MFDMKLLATIQVAAVLSVKTYARILSATLIVQLVSWRITEPVLVGLKF